MTERGRSDRDLKFGWAMSTETDEIRNPGVNFPPPVLFVLTGLCGSAIEANVPLPLSTLLMVPGQMFLGLMAVVFGASLLAWALLTLATMKTAIYPNQAARELVAQGPYRFSRNPMYVALTAMTFGIGLLADNIWILLLLPIALVALTKLVIQREEHYLAEAFGESYRNYQLRVRRWL